MSEIGKEIRLDLMINGTRKTFTQSHVPYSKALDYTDGEAKLLKRMKKAMMLLLQPECLLNSVLSL